MYPQHMLLKIRKTILKFTFIPRIMPLVFASFKHLKLPINIKMPVFEFMNDFFATCSLVVAWL